MNMLIKMTKIANPAGDLEQMRVRLGNIVRAEIIDVRFQIAAEIWRSSGTVDWQLTFLNHCQTSIDQAFQVDSPRWQIGYVEIA